MKKELTELDYPPEQFVEEVIRPLEVMEQARQEHLAQELFDRLVGQGRHEQVSKVGKFMQRQFNIDLTNK